MISEMAVYCRDSLKMNVLREILAGEMTLAFCLDGEAAEDYASSLHREDSRMRVYGKFNLSEDPTGEVLTVRPIAAETGLRIDIACRTECAGKTLNVVRASTKTVERTWEWAGLERIALLPSGDGFTMRLTYRDVSTETNDLEADFLEADFAGAELAEATSAETNPTENAPTENAPTEPNPIELSPQQPPQSEEEKRRLISSETDKDQTVYQAELEELAACVEADASVLAYYRDKEIRPTEELLKEIREKIEQAETQIRLLIEARQRKTAAIEAEIKHQKSGSHE